MTTGAGYHLGPSTADGFQLREEIKEYQKSLKSEEARLPGKSEDKNAEKLKLEKEIKEVKQDKSFLGKLGENALFLNSRPQMRTMLKLSPGQI